MKLVRLVRKKIDDHRRKTPENDNFLTKQSPFLRPNFIRGSMVIVIPHNVELCKQYFYFFIPISNSEKPVAGNKCYAQTKDIIIHPLTEYLCNDINQCGATSCHTCNIFINDRSFKSNFTGREYKTISYDRLSCGSTNVIYGIHCVH